MIIVFFLIQLKCRQYLSKWLFISLCPGSTEMVSAILEAGCDTSVKMGIPATVTPMSLATDLGLEDIIELLSKASISWQFCPFSLSSLEKYCVLLRWSVVSHNMYTVTHPPVKINRKSSFPRGWGSSGGGAVRGGGELEWHSKCPLTTPWVEVHYGGLQTLTLFTVSQKTTQKKRR